MYSGMGVALTPAQILAAKQVDVGEAPLPAATVGGVTARMQPGGAIVPTVMPTVTVTTPGVPPIVNTFDPNYYPVGPAAPAPVAPPDTALPVTFKPQILIATPPDYVLPPQPTYQPPPVQPTAPPQQPPLVSTPLPAAQAAQAAVAPVLLPGAAGPDGTPVTPTVSAAGVVPGTNWTAIIVGLMVVGYLMSKRRR